MALSADPVFWASFTVGRGDDPDCFRPNEIGDVVGEDLQIDPAISLTSEPRQFRVKDNPLDNLAGFCLEANSQPRLDLLVVGNTVIEFLLGLIEDFDSHG